MKYKNEVIINAPREKVVALFDDPKNLKEWQPGFVSMELIEGELGKVGSKHKLLYKMGKREIEMIETITKRNLPDQFSGTYEAKKVFNAIDNHFEDLGDGTTKYWAENEFRLSGSMKIFGWLMPDAFKKQSQKYMDDFKAFVERSV
ncbi:MAG: SRPBCC family protein [Fluviicola sp.]